MRSSTLLLLAAAVLLLVPSPAAAQYFGRNKVQYEDFDFRILNLPHWDLYFYPSQEESITDVARMAERWYERFARTFQHEFERTKPLIMYADHADFQQTNTLSGFLGESTGGVTESLKNRVIMPQTGSYQDTDHVLGHEIVHAFQYNIAQSRRGGGMQGLGTLPLWLVEGMAEYLSVGREDPLTGMWLRDALRRDDFPTVEDLTEGTKYFPYRFGQAIWSYIGGTYGDDAVTQLFRRAIRIGFEPAIEQVLGVEDDTLSAEWRRAVERAYVPRMADRTPPDSTGTLLLAPATGSGTLNVGPALSPDGRFIAYISEKDLFSVDLFLADAQTGEEIRKLSSATSSPHFDALSYVETSGTWSPDGTQFAFIVFSDGDNEIVIVDTRNGDEVRKVKPVPNGRLNNPAWSPDGRSIAFSATVGGLSDLYLYDVEDNSTRQLTDDKHADFHPDWSPDGRTIAFASDRGPETDFEKLSYSEFQLSFLDLDTRQVTTPVIFGNTRHSNPQYAPDGTVYFLSAPDGFSDVYRLDPRTGAVSQVTRIATGVSGITSQSPALSVADRTGDIAFNVFAEFEFHIMKMAASPPVLAAAAPTPEQAQGRQLPPLNPDQFSRVMEYLGDPNTGLVAPGTYRVEDAIIYEPELALDYVGQPSLGVGTDQFGNYVGGGAAAYFSDMLGNNVLGVSVQAQGTVKDIGGAAFYSDLGDRWNWGVGLSHIPYVIPYMVQGQDENGIFLGQIIDRLYVSSATGQLSYPFSQTRRFEASAGFTRYASNQEIQKYYLDDFRRIIARQDEDLDARFEPLNLANATIALVRDNSFMAFTSPVRGGRSRYELGVTAGTLNFVTASADWRRYFGLHRNLTFATRALHFGRYGNLSPEDVQVLQPTFLGFEWYLRGYAYDSFTPEECIRSQDAQGEAGGSCPVRNRMFGHKLGVMSAELRLPLLGVEEFGLINFPYVPTELVGFFEGGIAWDSNLTNVDGSVQDVPDEPIWELAMNDDSRRVPVFSAGVAARMNILGFMVLEAYYAFPFQRPERGPHFGFQIAPGW